MKVIEGLTDQPNQRSSVILPDGTSAVLTLNYKPQQMGWFYSLEWGTFALNGARLVASPNMLRQYQNLLPFGLALLMVPNTIEPTGQTVFVDGSAILLLLDAADVEGIEEGIFAGE